MRPGNPFTWQDDTDKDNPKKVVAMTDRSDKLLHLVTHTN